jgi:23S rRNA (guanine745-N1)-methyltransferase
MPIKPFTAVACPLDMQPLVLIGKSYQCAHNHNFDVAKQGDVNLLPVQFKQSKNPGDDAAMVAARQSFLATGLYDCILQKLCQLVQGYMSTAPHSHINIIDAGCGEGYYTAGLAKSLSHLSFSILGFDISKNAIKAAVKTSKDILWAVATNKKMPVQTASAHVVLSLFGFPVYAEFRRVLKPNGLLIMVEPAHNHLIELRQALYPQVKQKDLSAKQAAAPEGFSWQATHKVQMVQAGLSQAQTQNLLSMTPHAHKAPKDRLQATLNNPPPTLTIDVLMQVYSKIN